MPDRRAEPDAVVTRCSTCVEPGDPRWNPVWAKIGCHAGRIFKDTAPAAERRGAARVRVPVGRDARVLDLAACPCTCHRPIRGPGN